MLRTIFSKTLYEKRWMALFWSIGVFGMALLMMSFYPSFSSGGFDEALESLPKSLQGVIGDLSSLKTVPGYVAQQVFALRIPLLTLIMGIVLFSSLLAADEEEGKLQSLLSLPVSRAKLFVQKFAAGTVISLVITSAAFIGVMVGLLLVREEMSMLRLFEAVIAAWLLTMAFGAIGYAIGAATGRRGLAGSLTGLIAFSSYLLTSFAANVPAIAGFEKLSLFRYYNNPAVAEVGLDPGNVLVFVVVIVAFLSLAMFIFVRRDIYQR